MAIKELFSPYRNDSDWSVCCDYCRSRSGRKAADPGEAAGQARKEGFVTVKGPILGDPMTWRCPDCTKAGNAKLARSED